MPQLSTRTCGYFDTMMSTIVSSSWLNIRRTCAVEYVQYGGIVKRACSTFYPSVQCAQASSVTVLPGLGACVTTEQITVGSTPQFLVDIPRKSVYSHGCFRTTLRRRSIFSFLSRAVQWTDPIPPSIVQGATAEMLSNESLSLSLY